MSAITTDRHLHDLAQEYITAEELSRQRAADVRLAVAKLSIALSGQAEPEKVTLAMLVDAQLRFEVWLGTCGAADGTVAQLRSRVRMLLTWAASTYPSLRSVLDPRFRETEQLVEKASQQVPGSSSVLRKFFRAAIDLPELSALSDAGADVCEAVYERLSRDITMWKTEYTRLCRALGYLQAEGDLPQFTIPVKPYQYSATVVHYTDSHFPNQAIAIALGDYDAKASDQALSASVWPHKAVKIKTKRMTIDAVEHYVSILTALGDDLQGLPPEEAFQESRILRYARNEIEVRNMSPRTAQTRVTSIITFVNRMFELPKIPLSRFFDREEMEPKRDKLKKLTSLDDHLALVKEVQRAIRSTKHPGKRLSLETLELLLYLNVFIPVRRTNLLSIRLDRHLIRKTPTGIWEIRFSAEETKGRGPLVYEVAEPLRRHIERYLRTTRRKILKRKESPYLFPTRTGRMNKGSAPLRHLKEIDGTFRCVRREDTKNFHITRDMVTHTSIRCLPNGAFIATKILGHRSPVTTKGHYFSNHGRSELLVDHRDMARILEKPSLAPEDYDTLVAQIAHNPHDQRRFAKAIDAMATTQEVAGEST